jgi:hypothetical protein
MVILYLIGIGLLLLSNNYSIEGYARQMFGHAVLALFWLIECISIHYPYFTGNSNTYPWWGLVCGIFYVWEAVSEYKTRQIVYELYKKELDENE